MVKNKLMNMRNCPSLQDENVIPNLEKWFCPTIECSSHQLLTVWYRHKHLIQMYAKQDGVGLSYAVL
jgi:hypothetical protein